ncbi:MAG: hypothetical protein HN472_02175 [Nitrospina sp.]|jgi:hypothetical protein|nr:hypothetical protein [Nitrospina sp.]MBT3508335.1 hypothetical protein [Nitrospina sp.]MBT3874723.1 hypothetical protein [Nitrospina sp.]MBT4049457.1 hypothetical protein [Nitrospina sp.]MBT4558391.1 hypothetical protein [Nitrospina sp.]
MSESNPAEESIKHSIRKNGFPEKIVRLPFKPVYDACKKHGTSLTDVLDKLQDEQIFGKIIGNHLEFRSREKIDFKPTEASDSEEFSWLKGASNLKGFQDAAKDAMGEMTPEKMAEARKMVENMSDEEKMNLVKMFTQRFDSGNKK